MLGRFSIILKCLVKCLVEGHSLASNKLKFCRLHPCLLMYLGSYIAHNMNPGQTGSSLICIHSDASKTKSSLKCTLIYAADVKSRQHFLVIKNSSLRLNIH